MLEEMVWVTKVAPLHRLSILSLHLQRCNTNKVLSLKEQNHGQCFTFKLNNHLHVKEIGEDLWRYSKRQILDHLVSAIWLCTVPLCACSSSLHSFDRVELELMTTIGLALWLEILYMSFDAGSVCNDVFGYISTKLWLGYKYVTYTLTHDSDGWSVDFGTVSRGSTQVRAPFYTSF